MARRRATRKWEVFAGRNRFWCDGRLMTAPQPGVFALTLALIVCTCALHFAFDCPFLAARVSPAVPACGALLAALTLSALLRTALSDPGILPRGAPGEAGAAGAGAGPAGGGACAGEEAARPPPRAREVLVRGRPVKLKYCFTCKMFRPPRASHCSLCDNCVERFDHHCPWVGNCVGKRNYRHFYTFVVSLAFLCVFVFACAVAHLALLARAGGLAAALRGSPASALVAAICFLAVWSVLGLAGFHTYLASTDQTTNEDIKGSFSVRRGGDNPYSRGNPCANCWHVLCGPLPPSLLDRRGELRPDLPPAFALAAPPAPQAPAPAAPAPPALVLQPAARAPPPLAALGGSYTNLFEGGEGAGAGAGAGAVGGGAHRHAYMNHSLDLDLHEVCIGGGGGGGAGGDGGGAGGGGALAAARLRLLLDTTMIDAALDLDDPEPPPAPPAPAPAPPAPAPAPPAPALELRAL